MDTRYYKLCIVGECNAGKSSIAQRYVYELFDEHSTSTIGAAYFSKIVKYQNSNVHLQIWDTAGQERYRTITPLYYRGAAAVIIVLDQNCVNSNKLLDYWIPGIKQHIYDIPIFIAINKSDLPSNLLEDTIPNIMEKYTNVHCKYVSAKTNENIEELFNNIVEIVYHDKKIPIFNRDTTIIIDNHQPDKRWFSKCSIL